MGVNMQTRIGTDLVRCVNDMINDVTISPLCVMTPARITDWSDFVSKHWINEDREKALKTISRLLAENKIIQYNLSDDCWSYVYQSRL
jgi:hypothetical protein